MIFHEYQISKAINEDSLQPWPATMGAIGTDTDDPLMFPRASNAGPSHDSLKIKYPAYPCFVYYTYGDKHGTSISAVYPIISLPMCHKHHNNIF